MQHFSLGIFSAAAIALLTPAFQQQQAPNPLLPDGIPPTLTAANWTSDYKAIRMGTTSTQATYMGMDMSTIILMGSMGSDGNRAMSLLPVLGARWTKGETVQIAGQTYYLTYKPEMTGMTMGPGSPSQNISITLQLDFVRSDTMAELEPFTGLTKDKFLADLKAANWFFKDTPDLALTPEQASRGDETRALSNIKQLDLGLIMYENDYDDLLPYPQATSQVAAVIQPYIKNQDLWQTQNPNGSRVLFNMSIGGVSSTALEEPANTIMLYEDKPWPDGRRAVAFTDGHAKLVDEASWEGMQKYLHLHLKKSAKPFPMNYMANFPPRATGHASTVRLSPSILRIHSTFLR